ncbi:MAG: flagellar export chaperone FliS [Thermodesulfobacteriota bacterium]
MTSAQVKNAYRRSETMGNIHPVKLIHLIYGRVITHLDLVVEAIDGGSTSKRGENLGRAIALITELNASIRQEDESEAASFLRGLYTSILVELPKIAISNDRGIALQARKYIVRLMEIWEETAMRENGLIEEPVLAKPVGQTRLPQQGLSVSI